MLNTVAGGLIGLLSGIHAATWGMYKDGPHEGFEVRKYLRSILLGVGIGAVSGSILPFNAATAVGVALLFGVDYVVERAVAEIYKTFLRQEDQSKYTIPMQFAVRGRVVEDRVLRAAFGLGYLTLMISIVGLLVSYQHSLARHLSIVEVVLLGALGGWVSAVGGAWKDAPVEGFQPLKFFRSPVIAAFWALVLAHLTSDLVIVMLASTGYTVATTETYKTFFFPSHPRGKFANKPVRFPAMLRLRQRSIPLYAAIWLLVLAAFALSLSRPAPLGPTQTELSNE